MFMGHTISPVRPVKSRRLRTIHIHLVSISVLVEDPSVTVKKAVNLHGEISSGRSTPLPVNADLEIVTNLVRIRTNNDWVVVGLVVVLIPLLTCSLVCYLDVNKRHTIFSRFPAVFRNIDLVEWINSKVKVWIGNWSYEIVVILFVFLRHSFLIEPSRGIALRISHVTNLNRWDTLSIHKVRRRHSHDSIIDTSSWVNA